MSSKLAEPCGNTSHSGPLRSIAINEYDKTLQQSTESRLQRIREAGLLVCMSYTAMSVFATLAFMHHLNIVAARAAHAMAWHKVSPCHYILMAMLTRLLGG